MPAAPGVFRQAMMQGNQTGVMSMLNSGYTSVRVTKWWQCLALGICLVGRGAAADPDVEGVLQPFLAAPRLEMQQVFSGERFPNVVVTLKGSVLATWGTKSVRVRRSEDGGVSWGKAITIASPGFHGGGTTVDETSGDILAFVEARHPPAPLSVYRSRDDGRTWSKQAV